MSIDGFECAGHPGKDDIPGLVLIPAAAKQIEVPMIASGGFADARGLVAALALCADGVNMGSRFMCAAEVVEILNGGGQFEDIRHLVAGARGARVYETGDLEAGIWWISTAMGLIDDISTVDAMITQIIEEAEHLINGRLREMVLSPTAASV